MNGETGESDQHGVIGKEQEKRRRKAESVDHLKEMERHLSWAIT
jgi:hypothetical protein